MAKLHPSRIERAACHAQWLRNVVASFALFACLVSLALILNNQYGMRPFSAFGQRTAGMALGQLTGAAETAAAEASADAEKYRTLGKYLAHRYRVSVDVATEIVGFAHAIGRKLDLDPALILAVISVESRFNPIAESARGAKGLMQVIPRFHPEKFSSLGGEKAAFEPEANIMIGARVLKEYLRHTGNLGYALQMYAGAAFEEDENSYAAKVTRERDRLKLILQSYRLHAAPL